MREKTETTETTVTMHDALNEFRDIWKDILQTGKYNFRIEELALYLTTFKDLDLRTQEDLQYFQFAVIFSSFIKRIRSR